MSFSAAFDAAFDVVATAADAAPVPPPDQTVWWDVPSTTADALAILRLASVDVDAPRIEALVPVAGWMLNDFRDAPEPPDGLMPPTYDLGITYLTVDLYLQKNSPPVTADDFGLSPGYVPMDPVQRVRAIIGSGRRRWGVG